MAQKEMIENCLVPWVLPSIWELTDEKWFRSIGQSVGTVLSQQFAEISQDNSFSFSSVHWGPPSAP